MRPLSTASFYMDEVVQTACEINNSNSHLYGSSSSSSTENLNLTPPPPTTSGRRKTPPFVRRNQGPRPHITLRYMQSLDGSLTVPEKSQLPDIREQSGNVCDGADCASNSVVHFVGRLRANHDAILVGINTVVRDDPTLLSGHGSRQARPVILDADLELPSDCQLLRQEKRPWLFCRKGLEVSDRAKELESLGVKIFSASFDKDSGLLDLVDVLRILYEDGEVERLVVEGGVRVLESFIRSHLFDKLVVIIVPCYGVGRALFQHDEGSSSNGNADLRAQLPRLTNIRYDVLGSDLVMSAEPHVD